jgi:hypothetical protein
MPAWRPGMPDAAEKIATGALYKMIFDIFIFEMAENKED